MNSLMTDRALQVAGAAGAAIATVMGYSYLPVAQRGWGIGHWMISHSADALMWAITGAIVAGAAVYCYRTLTKKEDGQNSA
jgi:hypothetical protein